MSMVIQLDSSALNALFPEGSEARLNLTTAVVNNFVTRLGVAKLSQVDAQVKAELDGHARAFKNGMQAHVDEILRKYDLVVDGRNERYNSGLMRLSGQAQLAIKDAVVGEFQQHVAGYISERAKEVREHAKERFERMEDDELKAMVTNAIHRYMDNKMGAR
mgnify:CR=1 FL=1